MSGSVLADILIPAVAFVALAVFIGVVLLADRNPAGEDTGQRPQTTVSGGTFSGADPRQQVPHRDAISPETLAEEGQTTGRHRPDE